MQKKIILSRTVNEYTGAIHNHSKYSKDGRIELKEIVQTAQHHKLDYLTINDHNNKDVLKDSYYERAIKKILLIVGVEVNDNEDNHHLLVFNHDKIVSNTEAINYIRYYAGTEAVTFAAHPNERRISQQFRKYEWLDRNLTDFNGVEIWNYSSSWLGKVKPLLNGLLCVFFPGLYIRKPLRKNLKFWDNLNLSNQRKSAIASTDAHDILRKWGPFTFRVLSFKSLFKALRTNVLLPEDMPFTEKNVLNALQKGHSYICNYLLGKPWNFYAAIDNGEGITAIFGDEIVLSSEMKFYYNLSMVSDVYLYYNGKRIDHHHQKNGFFKINEAGFYRLEISRYRYGWIYTNPIYVLPFQ